MMQTLSKLNITRDFVSADMYVEHVGSEINLNMVYCDRILNMIHNNLSFIQGVKRNEI